MKQRIYCILICCFGCFLNTTIAQTIKAYQCGHTTKKVNSIPDNYKKKVFSDRFGNLYTEDELEKMRLNGVLRNRYRGGELEQTLLNGVVANCTMPNFLNVLYSGSWTPAEQNTVCEVINYLMSFINPSNIPSGNRATIIFEKATLGVGVAGVGTPFYLNNCGVQNSPLVSFLSGRQPAGFNSLPMALVKIADSGIPFYNGSMPIPNTSIDLYTVVLHEILHTMGFASLIGLNGNMPTGSSGYSRWDNFLTGGVNNSPLLVANTDLTAACCGEQHFNTAVFNNFTSELSSACTSNTQFRLNGVNIAPINRVGSNMNDMGEVLNRFSHLDEDCATGQAYVMHPSVQVGVARRILNAAEISILCALGYPIINPPSCSNCFGVLNDDLDGNFIITLNMSNAMSIPIADLTNNDILPAGNITYSIVSSAPEIRVRLNGTSISVQSNWNSTGVFRFRYRATGCNGDWCDEAEVEVRVREKDVCTAPSTLCTLTCFGDFEGFQSNGFMEPDNNYFNQAGIPSFFIENGNSPDVVLIHNNKLLHLFGCGPSCDREVIQIPLNQPITPNCTLNVTFRAASTTTGTTQPKLRFFALNNAATGNLGNFSDFQICPVPATVDAHVKDCLNGANGLTISNIYPTIEDAESNLQPYSFTWTNNTGSNITHLLLLVDAGTISDMYRVLVDNIVLTSSCQVPITIQPNNPSICAGTTLTFSANAPIGSTFSWAGPNGFTTNTQQVSIVNTNALMSGVYTVTVTNAQGCTANASITATVNPLPMVAPLVGASTLCMGATTSFTSATTGGVFTSSAPNVATISSTGTITSVSTGTATITYTITTANGCSNSVTKPIAVMIPAISIGVSPLLICKGSDVFLTATSGFNTYTWNLNGVGLNTREIINIQNNTTVNVTGTAANGCTATASTTIIVDATCCPSDIWITGINYDIPLRQSSTRIRAKLQTTILNTASVKLDADPTNGFVEIVPLTTADFFLSQPSSTGVFIAQALDGCGIRTPQIAPPVTETLVRKPPLGTGTLKAYPNPVNNKLTLEFNIEESQNVSIRILDLSGREILRGTTQKHFEKGDHFIELDVSNLLPGFYLYRVDGLFKKVGKFTKI